MLIVIAGPNGSGKTSVTSKILHHEWLEDSDNITSHIVGMFSEIGTTVRLFSGQLTIVTIGARDALPNVKAISSRQ